MTELIGFQDRNWLHALVRELSAAIKGMEYLHQLYNCHLPNSIYTPMEFVRMNGKKREVSRMRE